MTPEHDTAPGVQAGGESENIAGGQVLSPESIAELDLDRYLDHADKLMLAAVRSGVYVLAVRCRVCGAPLTSKRSRARGVGPRCGRGDAA